MAVAHIDPVGTEPYRREPSTETRKDRWAHCHVNWTAVVTGALTTFSLMLLFGLIGIAVGAHLLGPEHRVVDLKSVGIWTLALSVAGAFFSAVAGGWCAAKIAGILHAEPAMIHGGIVWLVMIPILVIGSGLGAAGLLGGWYASFGPRTANGTTTPFVQPERPVGNPTPDEIASFNAERAQYDRDVKKWNEETPRATRNSALGGATALLLGLLGSVIGAWMGCGEPMNFSHYKTRRALYHTGY